MVQIIFSDIVPLRYRAKWFGFIQIGWAVGSITGPLIGGLFTQNTTWRWVFYLNFPFCAIGLVIIPLVVKIQNKNKLCLGRIFSAWTGLAARCSSGVPLAF